MRRTLPGGAPPTGKPRFPGYDHLAVLTDALGPAEHALGAVPRPERGYRLDDAARGLVITCRDPNPGAVASRLQDCYLDFVLASVGIDGACHSRRGADGRWSDEATAGAAWGRAVWALGVAAAAAPAPGHRARALAGFRVVAQRRSAGRDAMAAAALGAAAVLAVRPTEPAAQTLARDAVAVVAAPSAGSAGLRLHEGGGAIAAALTVVGDLLSDHAVRARGLRLLAIMLRAGVRGQAPGAVAALAETCAVAYQVTGDPRWLVGLNSSWRWFLGHNDAGAAMFDPRTGGGYDRLPTGGAAPDQGAEATLAVLSTAQHVCRIREMR